MKEGMKKRLYAGTACVAIVVLALVILFATGILGNKKTKTTGNTSSSDQTVSGDSGQPGDPADLGQPDDQNNNSSSGKEDPKAPKRQQKPDSSPTDSPVPEEEVIENYTDEYILPYSDSKYLKKADVKDLPLNMVSLAKDELYARHGRIYNDAYIQAHFDECGWYTAIYTEQEWNEYGDSYFFNKYEKKNRDFLEKWIKKLNKQ